MEKQPLKVQLNNLYNFTLYHGTVGEGAQYLLIRGVLMYFSGMGSRSSLKLRIAVAPAIFACFFPCSVSVVVL